MEDISELSGACGKLAVVMAIPIMKWLQEAATSTKSLVPVQVLLSC